MPIGAPSPPTWSGVPTASSRTGIGRLLISPPQIVTLTGVEGNAGTAGQATASLDPPGVGYHLEIYRIEIDGNSTTTPTLGVYRGSTDTPAADFSNAANGDISEELSQWGIVVPGNASLILAWSGLSAGAVMRATITLGEYYDLTVQAPATGSGAP